MMRGNAQVICVIAIGLGAGLFSVGHYLEPPMAPMSPNDLVNYWNGNDDVHIAASILRGFGVCFLTSGTLGIVIPWINVLVFRSNSPANATTASVPPLPSAVERL